MLSLKRPTIRQLSRSGSLRSTRVTSHRPMNSTQFSGEPPFQLSTKIGLPRLAAYNGRSLRWDGRQLASVARLTSFFRKNLISLHWTRERSIGCHPYPRDLSTSLINWVIQKPPFDYYIVTEERVQWAVRSSVIRYFRMTCITISPGFTTRVRSQTDRSAHQQK